MLRVIELFSGVGAQRQGLKEAGIKHEVVAISEIDKYALKVYEKLHGETPNLGDIKLIERLPKADLWTYSFPCTDISLAGKQKGFNKGSDTQSSLLWEVERLLNLSNDKKSLPKYLLMENVKALVSKRFVKDFNEWQLFLESLGYRNFWQVLNAKDYGIPQNRERVFMISIRDVNATYTFPDKIPLTTKLMDYLDKDVDEKYYLSIKRIVNFTSMEDRNGFILGLTLKPHNETSPYAYTITTAAGTRLTDNYIIVPENTKMGFKLAEIGDGIYTNRPHQKRGVVQKSMIPTIKTNINDLGVVVDKDDLISIRKLTPRETWRLMGWNDADIDRAFSADVSETQLYKMAGNSIVVNCLTELFNNLRGELNNV